MKKLTLHKLIDKIEGEAHIDFTFQNDRIESVRIAFGGSRGIESILKGKSALDATVITPRVCGICNHAHLIAAVRAIEEGYRRSGVCVELSSKAKRIRDITLGLELVQNHIKWFYLTLLPKLCALVGHNEFIPFAKKAHTMTLSATKAVALFSGQWPHSSYAVVGGVTCDPTQVELLQALFVVDRLICEFEQEIIGIDIDRFLSFDKVADIETVKGDMGLCITLMRRNGLDAIGRSHDRFMVLGGSHLSPLGKSIATVTAGVDTRYVETFEQEGTASIGVAYKGRLYEVGPLARAMVSKNPMIRALHKRYKDAVLCRVYARVQEAALLLVTIKQMLQTLPIDEPSCVLQPNTIVDDFEGEGSVEAARGSLIHRTKVRSGKIVSYEIITPTQWNLSNGLSNESGIAALSMLGLYDTQTATLVFRTFDVCSVCTVK